MHKNNNELNAYFAETKDKNNNKLCGLKFIIKN